MIRKLQQQLPDMYQKETNHSDLPEKYLVWFFHQKHILANLM